MSWSVSAIGMPKGVLKHLTEQFDKIKCNESEESIKNSIRDAVTAALTDYPPGMAVKVLASGSQYGFPYDKPVGAVNSVNFTIEAIPGFVDNPA